MQTQDSTIVLHSVGTKTKSISASTKLWIFLAYEIDVKFVLLSEQMRRAGR